jgi:hypothetical protein
MLLHLLIYLLHGGDIEAKVEGRQLRAVTCEKCGTEFCYELTRVGVGHTPAHCLSRYTASVRAQMAAERDLAERLGRDVDLVPCPSCKWVNHDLIARYRKSKYRGWTTVGVIPLAVGAVTSLCQWGSFEPTFSRRASDLAAEIATIELVSILVSLGVFLLQWALRRRISPNRSVDGNPRIPPGTPPALVRQATGDGGETLVAVPGEAADRPMQAKWAIYRAAQLSFTPVCCQCLAPATGTYTPLIVLRRPQITGIPICHWCMRRIRIQCCLRSLCLLPMAVYTGWVLRGAFQGSHGRDPVSTGIFFGLLAEFLAVVLVDRWLQPYRVRAVDRSRGLYKIRFDNPAYTAIVNRQLREAEGCGNIPDGLEAQRPVSRNATVGVARQPVPVRVPRPGQRLP